PPYHDNRHEPPFDPPRSDPVTSRWSPARLVALCTPFVVLVAYADGPADNVPDKVRPVPPPGVQVPDAARKELQYGVDQLGQRIEHLKKSLEKKPALLELLPDVEIYHNAVRYALTYNEFYIPGNTKEEDKPKAIEKQVEI